MPWKTSSVMEEKLRFVFEHELQERTMTELCERYEITRQTGYMWLRRYREAGAAGLLEHSRAAHRHHNQIPEEIEQQVCEPEYPTNMLVRSVRRQGHFGWKQDEVFLSEVLWGERVGLLQEDDRWFTVYFAQHPIALFDSQQLRVAPLLTNSKLEEGEGDASSSPSSSPLVERDQKVSDMRPV